MDGLKRAAKQRIVIEHASKRWEDGMPLGNGKIGCLIWGTGEPLRFHLDRYDLWDEREAPQTKEPGFCYRNLIKLVRSGDAEDFREHDRLFDELRFSGEKVCRSELSLLGFRRLGRCDVSEGRHDAFGLPQRGNRQRGRHDGL